MFEYEGEDIKLRATESGKESVSIKKCNGRRIRRRRRKKRRHIGDLTRRERKRH